MDIINRTLQKNGLIPDEGPDNPGTVGPYVQSVRVKEGIYTKYAKMLIQKKKAYYCFCTKERLDSLRTEVNGKEILMYDKHCPLKMTSMERSRFRTRSWTIWY